MVMSCSLHLEMGKWLFVSKKGKFKEGGKMLSLTFYLSFKGKLKLHKERSKWVQ